MIVMDRYDEEVVIVRESLCVASHSQPFRIPDVRFLDCYEELVRPELGSSHMPDPAAAPLLKKWEGREAPHQ